MAKWDNQWCIGLCRELTCGLEKYSFGTSRDPYHCHVTQALTIQ